MSKQKLSPSEQEIMDFFWSSEQEKCKQDVLEHFGTEGMNGSMVSFLLSKLTKKGFLIPRRDGRNFFYQPAITKRDYSQSVINESLSKSYGQPLETILAHFCGKTSVSDQDVEHIRAWLKNLEEELDEK